MLIPLEAKRRTLRPVAHAFAGGMTSFSQAPAGAGGFRFDLPTVGFVLTPQRSHEGRYGSDVVRRMPLDAGMGWVLPAGVEGWCAWSEETAFLNVGLSPDLFALAELDPARLRIGTEVSDPLLVQFAMALHENAEVADSVGRMYRDTLALGLAAHMAKAFGGTPPPPAERHAAHDRRFRRVIDHIEAHLAEDLSIDRLAGIAALSPFHFARSFKQATGLSPHKFVANRRVERAKALLKSGDLPVAEIAFRVGWDNVSHFTQVFRGLTGATPGAFRAGIG